jgi:WD40 repeat protein
VCCHDRGEVVVFDRKGELVSTVAHEGARAAAFSPDDKRLAIIGGRILRLCRAHDGGEVYCKTLTGDGYCVAFSPDGSYLAYGGRSALITLIDRGGQVVHDPLPCKSYTNALKFSPDGSLLASGHDDSAIRLWSVASGKLKAELAKHARAINRLAFSADGRTLLSAGLDGTIRAWSVGQSRDYGVVYRARLLDENQPASDVFCDFSLSSDDRRLALLYHDRACKEDIVELWDLQVSTASAE